MKSTSFPSKEFSSVTLLGPFKVQIDLAGSLLTLNSPNVNITLLIL